MSVAPKKIKIHLADWSYFEDLFKLFKVRPILQLLQHSSKIDAFFSDGDIRISKIVKQNFFPFLDLS